MKPRFLLVLPATLVFLACPGFSSAQDIVYDTSTATIACTTLSGTVQPKPVLSLTAQPTVLTIKARLSGCTVTGAVPSDPPLEVRSGSLSAKLAVTGDATCASLINGFQTLSSFVVKWKTAPGQVLDFETSAFVPDTSGLVPGLVPLGMTYYGSFTTMGVLAANSAFAGTTPGLLVVSAEDIYTMLAQCCTDAASCSPVGEGIKKLHFGLGQVQM